MNEWIPLMEYSMKTGVSLSTLRRHIKANKVRYRIENGKYLILHSSGTPKDFGNNFAGAQQDRSQDILNELKKAQEEIAELKTLIAFYEESLNSAQL